MYVRAHGGEAAAARLRERFFTNRYAREVRERGDSRSGRVTRDFARATYGPMIYGKAPLFFDEVRTAAGDERFAAWLRSYADSQRYRLADANALLLAADASGIGDIVRAAHGKWIVRDQP
jgi:hypothetical protein